jgi:guanine deaminase
VLAHGIWLDETDRRVLVDSGAHIAHCPSSNLFLGSGLFDWRGMREGGVQLSLASDVGGGTSLSLQRNLLDAYKIQALRGERLTAWVGLHAATRGAAESLGLAHEIGSFDAGCTADLCVWDWTGCAVSDARDAVARGLHERLFAWMCLSDQRNLRAAYVAGRAVHRMTAT